MLFHFGTLFAQTTDLNELVRKIDVRTKAYPEFLSYTATAVSRSWEMNAQWKPEKEVVVTKRIVQHQDSAQGIRIDETVIRAVEIIQGREKDVTEKMKGTVKKRRAKQRRTGPEDGDGKGKRRGQGFSMSNDDIYPFGEKKKNLFRFTQLADTAIGGKSFLRIQAEAKVPDQETYEGRFTVDRETYDVLLMDVQPSKNPKFVKRITMQMEFDVLPGPYIVLKRFWMLLDASLLIKKIRMEFEETHSDVRVTGPAGASDP